MTITSTATEYLPITVREYPKIMKHEITGLIVFMTEHRKGIVLHRGDSINAVGQFADTWDIGSFRDYTGTVTIGQE